jgi:D-glycero-D-manno-heptose 1,7-bisphosphate phosphatase
MSTRQPAAFIDRDGTIIRECHFLADPAGVELLPGAADAIRRLRAAGYRIVVATNQSGIARGLFSEAAYRTVQAELERQLATAGAHIDAAYHCPHHPSYTGPCVCRKPGLGMFEQAAAELGIDLAASVYIGDRVRDVAPAAATGGRGFLVLTGYGAREAATVPAGIRVTADLSAAVDAATGVDTAAGAQ